MRPAVKGSIVGTVATVVYLLVVVVTTPALPPEAAMNAALQMNSVIIFGIGIGVGFQVFLTERGKQLGCRLQGNSKRFGGNSGGTAATSFFSFFSLVPLGCCGWWLYVLSLLPGILGSTVSGVLIKYSQPLAYLSLAIIFGFNAVTYYKLRRERRIRNDSAIA